MTAALNFARAEALCRVADPHVWSAEKAALMVDCATRDPAEGLLGLVRKLSQLRSGDMLSYDLPSLADPSALRACVDSLSSP